MRKYVPYLVIFIGYFLVKLSLFSPLTITNATVIRMNIARDTVYGHFSGKYITPYPVMSYTEKKSGKADTTTDDDPGSFFHTYKVGDNVQVCYKPTHPENARLYSFLTWWLPIGNLGLLILGCIAWIGISKIFSKKLND